MASEPSDASNGSSLALSSSHTEPACAGNASSSTQLAISDSSMEITLHRREPTPGVSGSASGAAASFRRRNWRSSSRTLSAQTKQKSPPGGRAPPGLRLDSVEEWFRQIHLARSSEFRQSEELTELRRKLQLAESQASHLAQRGAQAMDERDRAYQAQSAYEAATLRARKV
jgi:hypothetical protein